MKNLLLLTILLTSLNSFGNVAFTVEGKLEENLGSDKELVHMILTTEHRKFKVVNVDHDVTSCNVGLFKIVNNYYPRDTYSLVEVNECYEEAKGDFKYCPQVYQPVCGMPKKPNCLDRICIQVMPSPKTYSNYCALHNARARFISVGKCQQASYL